METDLVDLNEVDGINLNNYFPYQQNFDTVLYVHKRVLEQDEAEEKLRAKKVKTEKKKKKIKKGKINNPTCYEGKRQESVLEQTVRFAKNLAPIVIPPDKDTPVFYTVECSKCRKKETKPQVVHDDAIYQRKKCKKIIETYRKERKHDRKISTTETLSHSSQSNTLDDLNNNQSLSCTISEQSDKREKLVKNEMNSKKKRSKNTFVISESFEAIAADFTNADDTKIKVQLMNNAEKKSFCDSIRSPVLNAVRECMEEFNNNEVNEELKTVLRVVKCNTNKLDKILDRLANIEKHLQNMEHTTVYSNSPRQAFKASTLEQLGEDIDHEKSHDDEFESVKRNRTKREDNRVDDLGCGEVVNMRASTSVGVKTDRPNRIPARFCWTDADKV